MYVLHIYINKIVNLFLCPSHLSPSLSSSHTHTFVWIQHRHFNGKQSKTVFSKIARCMCVCVHVRACVFLWGQRKVKESVRPTPSLCPREKSMRRKDGVVIALRSQGKEGGEFTATISFLGRVLEGWLADLWPATDSLAETVSTKQAVTSRPPGLQLLPSCLTELYCSQLDVEGFFSFSLRLAFLS